MTRCEYLQTRMDECARIAAETDDIDLKLFFARAAEGFCQRLMNSTVAELEEEQWPIR